ncbi:MAG: pilus (MSHA type) biogenesis protein MshL [Pseudomonadota bacterium]
MTAPGTWHDCRPDSPPRYPACISLLALLLTTGCAPLQPREPAALPAIQAELGRASEQARQSAAAAPQASPALPPAVAAALAPPTEIRLEAPAAPAEPRFDLAVNNAPAQQVFLGIATGTRYSMLLHPDVAGSLTLNLKDVNVPEALAAIRDLYGYDYRIEGNRILVQPLTAQTRFYSIPYPTSVRQGKSELRVISGSIADSGGNNAAGSTATSGTSTAQVDSSKVTTDSRSDFWNELKGAVGLLIGCNGGTCPPDRNVMVSPHTGMLAVRALPKEHRQVGEYLQAARLTVERQVMIEAKIIEVSLNEGAQSGINWAYFNNHSSLSKGSSAGSFPIPKGTPIDPSGGAPTLDTLLGGGLPAAAGAVSGNALNAGIFGLALQTTNFLALINFLETQGGVQVLSSPRIAAINNQKAVLKVGTDEFFVTNVSTTTNTGSGSGTTTPNITLQPFFSGIALDVTPQIDETGHIILHVHPSVSQVTTVEKNINLGSGTSIGNITLPLASSTISETDSVVRLKDGEIAAIGGLMKRASQDTQSAVPGLGKIPGLGALFRNDAASRQKHELVILLKPTVIKQAGDWMEGVNEARERLQ